MYILQTYVEHSLENNCMSVCMCTTVVGELTESWAAWWFGWRSCRIQLFCCGSCESLPRGQQEVYGGGGSGHVWLCLLWSGSALAQHPGCGEVESQWSFPVSSPLSAGTSSLRHCRLLTTQTCMRSVSSL